MKNLGKKSIGEDLANQEDLGPSIVEISQTAYDALSPPDANTIYLITS